MDYKPRQALLPLVDGAILEIPLAADYGFAYAKYVSHTRHPELGNLYYLIRVFDYYAPQALREPSKLLSVGYAFNDMLVSGLLPAVAQGRWRVIGRLPVLGTDVVPPLYRKQYPQQKPQGYWVKLTKGGRSEVSDFTYEEVACLRDYVWQYAVHVELELSLYFMRQHQLDPLKHLELNEDVQLVLTRRAHGFPW